MVSAKGKEKLFALGGKGATCSWFCFYLFHPNINAVIRISLLVSAISISEQHLHAFQEFVLFHVGGA